MGTSIFAIERSDKVYYDANIENDVYNILERLVSKYYYLLFHIENLKNEQRSNPALFSKGGKGGELYGSEHMLEFLIGGLYGVRGVDWNDVLNLEEDYNFTIINPLFQKQNI
tara:strand:- start:23 stop:358 length:336 start_codon:yes stop_codon:yes gene_type:complete